MRNICIFQVESISQGQPSKIIHKVKAGCYFPLEDISCDIFFNSTINSNEKSEAGINTEGSEYSTSCSIVTYWHGKNHLFISTVLLEQRNFPDFYILQN